MADNKTIPVDQTPFVEIENPEQASTNFYWLYETEKQVFNMQTTVRGVLPYDQIKAHIRTALETAAHVLELGGQAKQVGKQADKTAAELPTPTPLSEIPSYVAPGDDIPAIPEPEGPPNFDDPPAQPVKPAEPAGAPAAITFRATEMILRTENGKRYFKVKGEPPYHLWGVTVWDEVLDKAGIPAAKLDKPTYDMTKYIATVQTFRGKDGKDHQKITHLEKVA